MTRVDRHSDLRAKSGKFRGPYPNCATRVAEVVGFFHPVSANSGSSNQTSSPISDEEIETARQQRTGRPLTDIVADLDR